MLCVAGPDLDTAASFAEDALHAPGSGPAVLARGAATPAPDGGPVHAGPGPGRPASGDPGRARAAGQPAAEPVPGGLRGPGRRGRELLRRAGARSAGPPHHRALAG